MYSYKERKTAVELYIKYGRRAARVIKESNQLNRDDLLYVLKCPHIVAEKEIWARCEYCSLGQRFSAREH